MQMPGRGERYNGPDGPVEVLAVDGVQGTVTVTPAGQPAGEQQVIGIVDWRNGYVFAGEDSDGMTVNRGLTAAARAGYEERIAGGPAPKAPAGAKEPGAPRTTLTKNDPIDPRTEEQTGGQGKQGQR